MKLPILFPTLFAASAQSFQAPLRRPVRLPSFPQHTKCKSTRLHGHLGKAATWLVLRGGDQVSDDTLAAEAFDWCSNLSAPAALVAGAVLATLSATREDLIPRKADRSWVRHAKKGCRALLLSSFAMEIFCIFVTTVTGTMLLSHGDRSAGIHAGVHYHSPMGFLSHNHEFEYLTSRVTFLQGLINWLVAVALEIFVPKEGEGLSARKMNWFISSTLVGMVLMILKFYNDHMTFYSNYGQMLWRYFVVTMTRYFFTWPLRPMSLLATPWIMFSGFLGWQAFVAPPDDMDEDEDSTPQATMPSSSMRNGSHQSKEVSAVKSKSS